MNRIKWLLVIFSLLFSLTALVVVLQGKDHQLQVVETNQRHVLGVTYDNGKNVKIVTVTVTIHLQSQYAYAQVIAEVIGKDGWNVFPLMQNNETGVSTVHKQGVTFLVLPGQQYRVVSRDSYGTGDVSIESWVEWELY